MTTHPVSPLRWSNIISYGLGDMANNFAFAMGAMFLLNYYTDVAGIPAVAAGTMLAVVRIYDAVMDLVAGRVIDRTSSRWGHFRPFLLWGAAPLMLLSVAVFSVPAGWSANAKLIYIYVTYALLGTAYSFVNIPYGALATVMTQEPHERARLGASRSIMAVGTGCFLALVLGPVIRSAKGEALQASLTRFTLALALIGVVLYFVCFKATREVVARSAERPKLKESLATLLVNRPLLILCACALCLLGGLFSMSAASLYYARYVLGDPGKFVQIVLITNLFGTLLGAPLSPLLVRRLGKKGVFLLGSSVAALAYLILFFSAAPSFTGVLGLLGLASVGTMLSMSVMWAIEADTVEYGEWRCDVRIEGLTYSFFSFTRKCGQALGGSLPAFLLAAGGYVPNAAVQSEAAQLAIRQSMALTPAVAFTVAFVLMLFYPLTDQRFAELVREIRARRNAGGVVSC